MMNEETDAWHRQQTKASPANVPLSADMLSFDEKKANCLLCGAAEITDVFTSEADASGLCLEGFGYSYCRGCDYYFVNPQPDLSGLKTFYNSHTPLIDTSTFETKFEDYRNRGETYRMTAELAAGMPAAVGGHYLDFGCNIGLLVAHNKDRFLRAFGVEINDEAVRFSRNELGLEVFPSVDMIPRDVRFDLISLIDVIEHVSDPVGLIRQLRGRLNPGGIIYLRLPVTNGLSFSRNSPATWKWVYAPYHLSMFSVTAVERLVEAAGMKAHINNDPEMFLLPSFVSQRLDRAVPKALTKVPLLWRVCRRVATLFVLGLFRKTLSRQFTSECVFVACEAVEP